jgi:TOMM system kinase/cyclase fusion protein
MRCPRCGSETPEGILVCEACGAALQPRCPQCGRDNPPQFKFCGACGTPLPGRSPTPHPSQTDRRQLPARPGAPEAERRQLTVLFCDLVDSTALAGRLDPEEWREVVRSYQATCAEVVQRYEGHIAQYLGDGLLIYFGYPQAHEDDAQRAVRTGLGMVEALGKLNAQLEQDTGIHLAVRMGIHTGLVVVGEMGGSGRQEQLALGDTPNIAARLQGLAAPNTVVLSAGTRRLVEAYFTYAELGPQALKGVATPLTVSQVLGASGVQSRFDAAAPRGFTPMVGREQEVGLLLERWAHVKDGMGQVVVLSGEAGIGKSRLVQGLQERASGEGATCMPFRCSPYHTNSALYPVIEHLEQRLPFRSDDTPQDRVAILDRALAASRLPPAEVVPLLAALLSLPHPQGYAALNLSPQRQRHKTHEALVAWLLEEAERQPVLTVWEDLHWADPSTLELLSLVIDQAPAGRLLTLLTCRPEFRPPWSTRSHVMQLTLSRLGPSQVEVMLTRLTGGKVLPAEVVQQIVAKTDGVPLFVEELTTMVMESGLLREREDRYELTGPLPPLAIPVTLQDSLMARLDRLATVKAVAQLGATIGRTFSYDLFQAASPLDEATVQHGLRQLVEAALVYQRGVGPQATYMFKHALIQDAAYQSLLRSTRQQYHQRIAQVLEAQFPETAETQPELLAHHYTEAGLSEQAIRHWQRAGQRAVQRSANVEAIAHLTKGLAVLRTLPDAPERARQELALQVALSVPFILTRGYTAPEVEATCERARELCQQIGDIPQLFFPVYGLFRFYLMGGRFHTAHELAEQLVRLAQHAPDTAMPPIAYGAVGGVAFLRGEFATAHALFERDIARYDPDRQGSVIAQYDDDPGVIFPAFLALILWMRGYPDQAWQRSQDALTMATKLAHPFSQVFALIYAAIFHQLRREPRRTEERAEATRCVSTEQGFPYWWAWGTIMWGWALAEQGRHTDGMAQLRQGLEAYRATGATLWRPYCLGLLAEAQGKSGQPDEGLRVLEDALALAGTDDEERWYEAELYRLKGELLRRQVLPDEDHADICFRHALDVARRQEAKSLELRAAMSLSRLWQQQGKRDEARELLAPIYGWFTEGFDTADLQEAKVLLEELS